MKKLIVDVDFTISKKIDSYSNAIPNINMINKLKLYKKNGYFITLFSARNMRTYKGDLNMIMNNTYPEMILWLEKNNIPFDEVILGKPWNENGFYIDDNAIRPLEFLKMSEDEIKDMLDAERRELWK